MDPDVSLMFVAPNSQLISRTDLKVELSDVFNRKVLPQQHEATINSVWTERQKQNPKLWNGTKFRLDSVLVHDGHATFNLGITGYKDFIGTNWSPSAKLFQQLGKTNHNHEQIHMSDALGVGALVQTADDYMVLIRRSQHCGEAVGLLDVPGGHPEPQELVGQVEATQIDLSKMEPSAVVDEIFDSIRREIIDEVNIPEDSITDPLLLGVARNTTSAGRPSSEYFVRCSLTSQEVQDLYHKGDHAEAEESTSITMVPMAEVLHLQDNQQLWQDLAPSAKGCVTLYQMIHKH